MKKIHLFIFAAAILHQTNFAQTSFQISSFSPTPEDFKYLLLTNKKISDNDTINEKILDLAEPMLLDSVVERRIQHHQLVPLGWFISTFAGFNWRTVNKHKEKFVGTVKNDGRSGASEYTEYDIKFHLGFHLQKYFDKILQSYDLQHKYHKQDVRPSHRTNYHVEPYERDSNNVHPSKYEIGMELTPPPAFIPQLNYLFFPTLPNGGGLKENQNFGTEHPSMGFYGVSCLDCNHNCHPEMHPYEWMWWLNLKDEETTDKTWLIGLMHEGSNRFKNWSVNPMTGEIKIPFAYAIGEDSPLNCGINIDQLVFSKFEDAEIKKMNLPEATISPNENYQEISFNEKDSVQLYVVLRFNNLLVTNGLKYWFSELNLDKQNHIMSGYFHLATSVQDLYTTKITFNQNYEY